MNFNEFHMLSHQTPPQCAEPSSCKVAPTGASFAPGRWCFLEHLGIGITHFVTDSLT